MTPETPPQPTEAEAALMAVIDELVEQRDALTQKVAHYRRLLARASSALEEKESTR